MPPAVSKEATPKPGKTPPKPKAIPDSSPLQRMAQRIARNREVLGLHFPSDSAAGKVLADDSFKILKQCSSYQTIRDAAKKEWKENWDF